MESAKIRELARLMHEERLTCLEYEGEGERIYLECAGSVSTPETATSYLNPESAAAEVHRSGAPTAQEPQQLGNPGMDFNDMHQVSSPLVGVFYAAPAEDQPPYVKVGDKVQQGDILCIVEAMKVMNEITAEQEGEIVDVCVRNGDVVEFGQPLFKMV